MIAAYINVAGWWRLRRSTPTECAGCRRPSIAPANFGALHYCVMCKGYALERLANELERIESTAALDELAERISAFETMTEVVAA